MSARPPEGRGTQGPGGLARSESARSRRVGPGLSVCCAALALAPPASAFYETSGDSSDLSLLGAAKLFPSYSRLRETALGPARNLWSGVGSLRLQLDAGLSQLGSIGELRLEAAYHLFPVVQTPGASELGGLELSGSAQPPGATAASLVRPPVTRLRLADPDVSLVSEEHFQLSHNLDRLSLLLTLPGADLRVGRQAISPGGARLFNAVDVFAPLSPASLDSEYKPGVDAIRLSVPLGEDSELELLATGHRGAPSRGVFLLRARHSFPGLDVAVMLGTSERSPTATLELSGDVAGATLYADVFYRRWTDAALRAAGSLDLDAERRDALRASAGVHYFVEGGSVIEGGTNVIAELHYQGPGASDLAGVPAVVTSAQWRTGESFLVGRYYAGVAIDHELSELVRLSASSLVNVGDPSALLTAGVSWDSSDSTQVGAGALVGVGAGSPGLALGSEFGLYPGTVYADLRWYF